MGYPRDFAQTTSTANETLPPSTSLLSFDWTLFPKLVGARTQITSMTADEEEITRIKASVERLAKSITPLRRLSTGVHYILAWNSFPHTLMTGILYATVCLGPSSSILGLSLLAASLFLTTHVNRPLDDDSLEMERNKIFITSVMDMLSYTCESCADRTGITSVAVRCGGVILARYVLATKAFAILSGLILLCYKTRSYGFICSVICRVTTVVTESLLQSMKPTIKLNVEAYENQRWIPGRGWSGQNLKDERNSWTSDSDGSIKCLPVSKEWCIDTHLGDKNGWNYFDSKWRGTSKIKACTRSRRWIKTNKSL